MGLGLDQLQRVKGLPFGEYLGMDGPRAGVKGQPRGEPVGGDVGGVCARHGQQIEGREHVARGPVAGPECLMERGRGVAL